MLVPTGTSKRRIFFSTFAVAAIFLLLLTPSSAQQAAPKPAPATPPQGSVPRKANPATEVGKAVGSRPSEAPLVLQQLNSALQALWPRFHQPWSRSS
jgi:hypothetical protein